MKKFIKIALWSLFAFTSLIFFLLRILPQLDYMNLPESDQLAYREIRKVGKQFQQKYGLSLSGEGLSGSKEKIKEFDITFHAKFILSKNKARILLVKCVQEFLEEINSFEKIQPFLDATPMTYKNVELTIFFTLPDGRTSVYPDLCCISLNKGIVEYDTKDPEDRFRYYSSEEETYEEALKIVESETR